ncbi:MAG: hypothetical protein GTN99_04300, partial [Candidatus Dadabacteria bacterium]|nr:hypothetical protein [Candidatus Dadabacteria bacterium]
SNLQNSIDAGQDNSVNTNISEKEFIEGEIAEKLPPKQTELDKRSKLQELLDNNYIKSDDKNYTFEATLKEGQISVNGTPVSLTPLMLQ